MAKIQLVEDDFSLRDIYSARFQAEGYDVVTASNGEEALAMAVREHPDLIVLDVMMPKISGFDVLDILRSTPETKSTKVIMMTALGQDADRQRGEALGVDKYLVKSQVTLEDVVTAVKQSLGPAAPPPPVPGSAESAAVGADTAVAAAEPPVAPAPPSPSPSAPTPTPPPDPKPTPPPTPPAPPPAPPQGT